jgi:hypothetical protein
LVVPPPEKTVPRGLGSAQPEKLVPPPGKSVPSQMVLPAEKKVPREMEPTLPKGKKRMYS